MSNPSSEIHDSQSEKANILLVDDRPENLLFLEIILEELGENLVKGSSGKEALRQLLKQDFALIILDINMPEMDGFEMASLIRSYERTKHIPIIFISAFFQSDLDKLKGYSLGGVDYILTPIVPEILKSKAGVFIDLFRITQKVKCQAEQLEAINEELEMRVQKRTKELLKTNQLLRDEIVEHERAEEEIRKQAEAMKEQSEQLRNLTFRLEEIEESQRRILARELHDRIGQDLTALTLNLHIIQSMLPAESVKKMGTRLEDALGLVEEMAKQVRDLMSELRPPVLDDFGLTATLHWFGSRFSEQTGIVISVQGEELIPRLPLPVETTLFRITQEALTNVVKHSKAKQVTLTLKTVDGRVVLTIADNGIGFDLRDKSEKPEGWGLITMRERAQGIGGHLRLEALSNQGTKIIVEVPRKSGIYYDNPSVSG